METQGVQAFAEIRRRFAAHGQEHVFRFWDRLQREERDELARQAARIDLEALARLASTTRSQPSVSTDLETVAAECLPEYGGDAAERQRAAERGEETIRSGRVAVMVVAGGQGTRLGFPGPKGLFPLGPLSERTLFELQAERIHAARQRYGVALPWLVMTSPATDAVTRAFFQERDRLGFAPEDLLLFCQATLPALDFEGRLLLESPSRIAESPDGHGGCFTALLDNGVLDQLAERGIDRISYYQVDNPLVEIVDPGYLGFHELRGAEMSCKVIRKQDPMRKLGVVARIAGRVGIVEYSEIDDENRNLRDAEGRLVYWAGSMGVHVLSTGFARRVAEQADALLPYHPAAKKIAIMDEEGRPVRPSEPNGHKLERFVFDGLAAAENVAVVEVAEAAQYSPLKNAEGPESPETARRDLSAKSRRWLVEGGLDVPCDAVVELDHRRIDGPHDVRRLGSLEEAGDAIHLGAAR